MKAIMACCALLASGAAVQAGDAPPFSIQGNVTLLWRDFDPAFLLRHDLENQDRWEFYSRTALNVSRGPLRGGFELDLNSFDLRASEQGIRKWYLEYAGRDLMATAGHFYASFGRGIALNIVKTHESYGMENQVDDAIEGGRVRYLQDRVEVEAVGGVVRRFEKEGEEIYGGNATVSIANGIRAGASAVKGWSSEEGRGSGLAGLHAEWLGLAHTFDIHAEAARTSASAPYANGATSGHAAYVEATATLKSLTITTEYENLRNFFFPYSTPPILEESNEELLADYFAIYREDLDSVRIRGDYTAGGTILYAAYAHHGERATRRPSYPRYRRNIGQVYGGIEQSFDNGIHIQASIGRRMETSTGFYLQFNGPTTYGRAFASLPISRKNSIEVEYRRSQLDGDYVRYQRNKLALSFARSQLLSLTGVWESSNLPGEVFHGGKINFYSAQAEVKIRQRHLVRILYGETRGGIKCSGGVCRYIPAFGGARVEGIVRF